MVPIQLDFFKTHEQCEMDCMRRSIEDIRKSSDKVRRGTYANINELKKEVIELKSIVQIITQNICKEKYDTINITS